VGAASQRLTAVAVEVTTAPTVGGGDGVAEAVAVGLSWVIPWLASVVVAVGGGDGVAEAVAVGGAGV
jgi:uncharacterized membrane protein YbhN (UPF0104 family)